MNQRRKQPMPFRGQQSAPMSRRPQNKQTNPGPQERPQAGSQKYYWHYRPYHPYHGYHDYYDWYYYDWYYNDWYDYDWYDWDYYDMSYGNDPRQQRSNPRQTNQMDYNCIRVEPMLVNNLLEYASVNAPSKENIQVMVDRMVSLSTANWGEMLTLADYDYITMPINDFSPTPSQPKPEDQPK
jgi:hypothetical protein